jgi:tRNA G18 (ribose-2'-O)-methylase SpoU
MTGASHSSVKRYRELARNPHKNGHERELLLDGPHLLFEARKSGLPIESAAFEQDALADASVRTLAEQLAADGADVFIVSRKVLETMSPVRTPAGAIRNRAPHGADAGRCARLHTRARRRRPRCSRPGECGRNHAHGRSRRCHRIRRDSRDCRPVRLEGGAWIHGQRVAIADRAGGHRGRARRRCERAAIATSALVPQGGEPLFAADFTRPSALVLGSEGLGLSDELLRRVDRRITVPMRQPVESLNVGVAAALVLYEAFRQRG